MIIMKNCIIFCLLSGVVFGNESAKYDTIVIGAGAAGVMAATTLARNGRHVLILEAQDRIGGRVYTVPFGDGTVEVGAEWLHGTVKHPAYDLAVQNNITILAQPSSLIAYTSDGSPVDQELFKDIIEFSLEGPEDSDDKADKNVSLGEFMTNRIMNHLKKTKPDVADQKDFMYMILKHINLQFDILSSGDDWNEVTMLTEYEQLEGDHSSSFGRHGYKTFFDMMLNTYNNGPGTPNLDIKLNTEVTNIKWSPEGGSVTVTTADGTKYEAENVIVTVSLGVLKEKYPTLFTPELPMEKINAIRNISMGCVDKIMLSFNEQWWPKEIEEFEFLWKEKDSKELNDDWTTKICNASPPMSADNVLTLWLTGNTARQVETLPDDEVQAKSMALLRRFMGRNITIPEPTGILRSKWNSNKYVRGSYTFDGVNMGSYHTARDDLAAPLVDTAGVPRVLFAGEATTSTSYSTVHGAAFSGRREANRILGELKA